MILAKYIALFIKLLGNFNKFYNSSLLQWLFTLSNMPPKYVNDMPRVFFTMAINPVFVKSAPKLFFVIWGIKIFPLRLNQWDQIW